MVNLPCIRRPISKLNEASTVVPSSNSVNITAATIIGAYIREEYLIFILYYSARVVGLHSSLLPVCPYLRTPYLVFEIRRVPTVPM